MKKKPIDDKELIKLLKKLKNPDHEEGLKVIGQLRDRGPLRALGPEARFAVNELIEVLDDGDRSQYGVRAKVIVALGFIGPEAKACLPRLVSILKNKQEIPDARDSAAVALGRMGEDALPVLIELLKDEDVEVRKNAPFGLKELGSLAQPAIPSLIEALADPDSDVRQYSAGTLAYLAPASLPALTKALENTNPYIRQYVNNDN